MNNSPLEVNNALNILLKYDVIFSDIWGVVHNGLELLPNVVQVYEELIAKGKKVVLISNSPRPSTTALEKLNILGFGLDVDIVTSGDLFRYDYLQKRQTWLEGSGYLLGYEKNQDLTVDINFNRAISVAEASFLVILDFCKNEKDLMKYDAVFQEALSRNLKVICPNPDILVDAGGSLMYANGAFAKRYADLGGEVIYYGKPYNQIFEYAVATFLKNFNHEKSNIIMIGDSMTTDIKGASDFGIDSMLLLTGITKESSFIQNQSQPTYICKTF